MALRRANSLLGALEGVSPENLNFFGFKKWHLLRSQPIQGPPLPMPLVMDLTRAQKPLLTVLYKQQVH
jgi:hypothetical protein